jgi:TetR/AcrR family transcriptional regulator, transcriptional repressor for nem operon
MSTVGTGVFIRDTSLIDDYHHEINDDIHHVYCQPDFKPGEKAVKVSREQFAENRKRILDAAAQLFRERGFENVTVAEVMSAAGLTHGGFYGHFDSKEDLIAAAMAHEPTARRGRAVAESPSRYADTYLSAAQRDNIGTSCPFSSLGTEAARASPAVRHTLTDSMRRWIDMFTPAAQGATPQERRRNAIGAVSAMVGAMVLARIADDERLSDEVLASTRASLRLS